MNTIYEKCFNLNSISNIISYKKETNQKLFDNREIFFLLLFFIINNLFKYEKWVRLYYVILFFLTI